MLLREQGAPEKERVSYDYQLIKMFQKLHRRLIILAKVNGRFA